MTQTTTPVHRPRTPSSPSAAFHDRAASMLRRLATTEPGSGQFLSAYLDLEPSRDQADAGSRASSIVLRDRLAEIAAALPAHGPDRESFERDAQRLRDLATEGERRSERGVAVAGCDAMGVWEELRTWARLDTRVELGPRPVLLPLARLVSRGTAVVALVDTNSLRLFGYEPGHLVELPAIDDEPDDYRRTEAGGWSQARYQRHVDDHRADFARRAASVIDEAVSLEKAQWIVLAGTEEILARLRNQLPKRRQQQLGGSLRLEMRATLDEVEAKALPELERLERAAAVDSADRLLGAIRGHALGVGGLAGTRRALEIGEGLEVVIDPAAPGIADRDLEEIVRLAIRTDAPIRFVNEHSGLGSVEGVGTLLRFKA